MRRSLIATLLLLAPLAHADDTEAEDRFYRNKKAAESNLQDSAGIQFDRLVGQAIAGSPDWKPGIAKCLEANPPPQEVRGFIHFLDATNFRLEVRPTGVFADCVADIVHRMDLPRPKETPYFQDFNFSTDY